MYKTMKKGMHKMPGGMMMSDKEMKKMMAKPMPKKMVKAKKVTVKAKKK